MSLFVAARLPGQQKARSFSKSVLTTLVILAFPGVALAGALGGKVKDANSASYLLGATVSIPELSRQTTTEADGSYSFGNLPAGTYTVTVSYLGYADASRAVLVPEGEVAAKADFSVSDVVQMSRLVVEGSREGQARALQQKRTAANVMDVVSADAVGKFPDGNAAEALRRVPGVSLEIDQDEGRYVVLRGIDSALNTVTLNNQLIGTPSEGANRGIALDSIPADLISRLEVNKAVTPEMDASAVGGSINIVTLSAFERSEPFVFGSVAGFRDHFDGRVTPSGSITAGTVFGPDRKWGVVAGGSYSLKHVKSQTVNTRSWSQVNNLWVPLTEQSYDYDIERERIGSNVAFQFRPSPDHELALRVNHNEFTDVEARQSVLYEYRLGTLSNQTASSGANSQGRASRQFRDYHQTGTIDAASLEGKHSFGETQLTWQAGLSRGSRDVPTRVDWEYRSSSGAFPNTYDLTKDVVVITPNSDAYYQASNYPFRRVRFRSDWEKEDVRTLQADVKRSLTVAGVPSTWKSGTKLVSREKKDDRSNSNYTATGGSSAFTLADGDLAGPEPVDYFNGLFRYGPTLNLEANKAYFAANPSKFTYDTLGSLSDSLSGDLEASEDVYAVYSQLNLEFSRRLSLLAGLRVETTETDYGAYELSTKGGAFSGSYRWVTGGRNYTNLFPGALLTWRPYDRFVVRAAWTNTLSRPNYTDLAPRSTLDAIETTTGSGIYTGGLSTGNPHLKPYESMNFDLSLEYYLGNGGIVSVGAFHKEIDNPIYTLTTYQTNVVYDGRLYQSLSTIEPENAKDGRITGVEFNYQQFFKSLPAPFDGFGVNFNLTLTDSSVTTFTRSDKLPFFKQSDRIANIALLYEKYSWEFRVAWSYSGDYLSSVGTNRDTDIYVRGRSPLDAKVAYRVSRNLKLFAEFMNLTEQPLREYTGVRVRENDYEIYTWKAKVGVNFNF